MKKICLYEYACNISILTSREGIIKIGNGHPEKTIVERGEAEVDSGFQGMIISSVALS